MKHRGRLSNTGTVGFCLGGTGGGLVRFMLQLLYPWGKSPQYLFDGGRVNTTFNLDAVKGKAVPVYAMKA
jgi:hypothetical protein